MRIATRCAVVVCLASTLGTGEGAAAQWWQPQGRLGRVEYLWTPGMLVLRAHVRGREPYALLGASAAFSDPLTHQRIVVDIPRESVGILHTGVQQVELRFENLPLAPPYDFVVKVWDRIVYSEQCQQGGGGPCQYCQKNGYHFEGELHSSGWIRVQPGLDAPSTWHQRSF